IVLAGVFGVDQLDLAQQLPLARREVDRRLDRDMAKKIAVNAAAHALDALVAQPEYLAGLRFGRNLELGVSIERGDLDLASQRSRRERYRHFAMQVAVVALE